MVEYSVLFEKAAQKALRKMDKSQANIVMAWIKKNLEGTDNPRRHGKPLVADQRGKWRYRIGDYRLICHIYDQDIVVLVLDIGHHREIYR
ncbi:MAG: type II toxin-antitoxin system RelE/ParE family toxin [Coriobacteriia bacterium]|nr:type II toxin-antitoxin system RelE/ParE family toxin [Coriobacteriia bacterium]